MDSKALHHQPSSPPPQTADRNWVELPVDITASILRKLGAIEILKTARLVCSTWRNICIDSSMWTSIDMHNVDPDYWELDYDVEKMCKYAVDRSCGGLISIDIEYFATDDLLMYIAERSSHLKQLRLAFCEEISDKGLSEAVKKMPSLEELVIVCCSIPDETLQVVAPCCPLLRSLKWNQRGYEFPHVECNKEALAIARNMPHLHHLEIIRNKLTNQGLEAILDGCPRLESLDLRQCFNIKLQGNLEKRCEEQIKVLQRPYDVVDDPALVASSDDDDYLSENGIDGSSDERLIGSYDDYAGFDYDFSDDSDIEFMFF